MFAAFKLFFFVLAFQSQLHPFNRYPSLSFDFGEKQRVQNKNRDPPRKIGLRRGKEMPGEPLFPRAGGNQVEPNELQTALLFPQGSRIYSRPPLF